MSNQVTSYIPPLAVSRMIGTYHFENGGYVALVSDGNVPTELIIEKAQALLDLKRGELASADRSPEGGNHEDGCHAQHESAVPEGQTRNPSQDTP